MKIDEVRIYNKSNKLTPIPVGAIYVGRPSTWGNPYKPKNKSDGERRRVIEAYRYYALSKLKDNPDWLRPLLGRHLVCWCAPKPCHCDVIFELLYKEGIYELH